MTPKDHMAARRSLVMDGAKRRMVPTSSVFRMVRTRPLEDLIRELNQPGILPTGLKASVEHIVILAAATALKRHSHFTGLLLPGGSIYEPQRAVIATALDGPGSGAVGLVAAPDEKPIDKAVAELDASEADGYPRFEGEARKFVLQSRTRPLKYRLLVDVLTEGLFFIRDKVKLPERWIKIAVEQTGNFIVHPLLRLGIDSATVSLTGPRHAHLLVGAIHAELAGPHAPPYNALKLGLAFDARIFEAHEAARFLADISDLLADPKVSMA